MSEITQFKTRQPENVSRFVSPEHQGKDRPFRKEFDRFREYRSSQRWQRLRELVLSLDPVCAVKGCNRPAAEVHHVIEAHVNPELFFEQDNLVSVCEECHKKVHAAYRRGIKAEMLFNNKLKGKGNE